VCPSAIPRPRGRQAAGRASRYRAVEGAVVAGPRTDGEAFGARAAEAIAHPSSHVWTPPKTFSAPRSLPPAM
jgi:hypothetical protein